MTIEPGFKKMLRDQPWDFKTKNEYEEVTFRQQPYVHMHYRHNFDERDYDIFDPRYTRLKSSDWEAFRDPKKFWYTTYVNNRKKLAEEIENGFSLCARTWCDRKSFTTMGRRFKRYLYTFTPS